MHRSPRPSPTIIAAAILASTAMLLTSGCSLGADRATTPTTTVPPWRSWIATPRVGVTQVEVLDAAGGEPLQLDTEDNGGTTTVTLPSTLESGAPLALLAKTLDRTVDGELYHEVYLPVRPNGSVGWVADDDVTVRHTDLRLLVDLSDRRIEVVDGASIVVSADIAVGTPENPTPTGTFFIKEVLAPDDPTGAYGPLAIGLSGYSPTILDSQEFADGVIGIHGTNQPELIGQQVSHGCLRLRNDDITKIGDLGLPLGTPVTIRA